MRAVALDEDVLLVRSAVWQCNSLVVRSGSEAFLIDSPILPAELEMLPGICAQAGFEVVGMIATHADWDHLLGRLAFPDAALAVGETTAARLRGEPGGAARELKAFDSSWYLERPGPLSLGNVEALPVPGLLELGERELELHPADGHTSDGMAVFARWCGVLAVGDYVSTVEIPMISEGGSLPAYRATLERLRGLVAEAQWVVPGHGEAIDPGRAGAIIGEDLAYLDSLVAEGEAAQLPLARRTREQERIHSENVERTARSAGD